MSEAIDTTPPNDRWSKNGVCRKPGPCPYATMKRDSPIAQALALNATVLRREGASRRRIKMLRSADPAADRSLVHLAAEAEAIHGCVEQFRVRCKEDVVEQPVCPDAETDRECEARFERSIEIATLIATLPATTLAGIQAKARIIALHVDRFFFGFADTGLCEPIATA